MLVGTAAPAVEAQVLINWPMPCPKVSSATSEWWNWSTSIPVLAQSRERFRRYREQGYAPETHKL
ncbi:MAG: hypothetical protein R3F36_14520 [Candidatus Competibacteraceae bacterium]